MWRHTLIAIKLTLVLTLMLGLAYPLVMTAVAQVAFSKQANGSLIVSNGKVIGSGLIAQSFTREKYFYPRPSAAFEPNSTKSAKPNNWVSSGSNLGPTSKALADRVRGDVKNAISENPGLRKGEIPADMVTASASGMDPDISPANAYLQVSRIAKSRAISEPKLMQFVKSQITKRQFGLWGEPRVNVLKLNMTLDKLDKQLAK